jgi:Protein of unknown function (DUF3224)
MSTRRIRQVLGVLTVAGFVVSSAAAARADGGGAGEARRVAFTSTFRVVGGHSPCDPTTPTRCVGTFETVRTYTGDFTGTSYIVGSAVKLPDGTYQGQDVAQFSGTIAGCGTGTVVMLEVGILDPATGGQRGAWTITGGQGTGDLALVSGSGTSDDSKATGTLRCQTPASSSSVDPRVFTLRLTGS